jgi:ribA/ribD-fused uncharacterized protein
MIAPMDLATLQDDARRGVRHKFLFFWSHQPGVGGSIGPSCLSQWWPAPFVLNSVHYPTAEHFMMAEKARLFGDDDTLERVLASTHPKQAKDAGRQVRGFVDVIWDEHRFDIVVRGSVAKFGQNHELKRFLLGTRQRVLVEASPVDRIWGIGLAADDPKADDPEAWQGLNLLGFALMEARERLGGGATLPPPSRLERFPG